MKIKCRPEDFKVEELIRLRIKPQGRYSIYRLKKRGWNTLDVIRQLQVRYGFPAAIGRAGLKDRYSLSAQYLSIPGNGPEQVRTENYTLEKVGMADQPVSRDVLMGNRFEVIVRSLDDGEIERLTSAAPLVRRFGFANYYDEQRFGSARHKQGFIAAKLILGHYNGALKLYLATPSSADDSRTKRQKQEIMQNWGNWSRCYEVASYEGRPVFKFLIDNPKDFAGAVKRIPRAMLELFINAYQGWLWNETLKLLLEDMGRANLTAFYSFGKLLFYDHLSPADARYLARLTIPAPAPRAEYKSEKVARLAEAVLKREGLKLKRLKLKLRIPGVFFKPYQRSAIVTPQQFTLGQPEPDELYPGRTKVKLAFVLPPGSYATILLKRLFAQR